MNNRRKRRFARRLPEPKIFRPNLEITGEIFIALDEYEAMRLCDYENLSQIEASEKMMVSRATVQRLLHNIRKKIIDATLHNKVIIISNDVHDIVMQGEIGINHDLNDMFLLAIPTNDGKSASYSFGMAQKMAVYKIENNNFKFYKFLAFDQDNIQDFIRDLKENNIKLILTKMIGNRALEYLKENDIELFMGFQGTFDTIIDNYLKGIRYTSAEKIKYGRSKNTGCMRKHM